MKNKTIRMDVLMGHHQAKCLALLLQNRSVEEVAEMLKIHSRTVEFYIEKLLKMTTL